MLLTFVPIFSWATIHTVEAGGSSNVTPYYAPQLLTINQGDTVIWDFVLGTHNVTTTSAPVTIESDDIESPGTFQWVFTVAGVYDYECSLWDHADTQFGTITVIPTTDIDENEIQNEVLVFPNPVKDVINFQLKEDQNIEEIHLFGMNGVEVKTQTSFVSNRVDVSTLSNGSYLLMIRSSEGVLRKKIVVQK